MKHKSNATQPFTLIELLVVIAINFGVDHATPMRRAGDGWQVKNSHAGASAGMWSHVLAQDRLRENRWNIGMVGASHYPPAGAYMYYHRTNGAADEYLTLDPTNANYLLDDGSVRVEDGAELTDHVAKGGTRFGGNIRDAFVPMELLKE